MQYPYYIGKIYANGVNTIGQIWIDKDFILHLCLCLPENERFKDLEYLNLTTIRFRSMTLLLKNIRLILGRKDPNVTVKLEYSWTLSLLQK